MHEDLTPEAYSTGGLNDPEVKRLEALAPITKEPAVTAGNRRAARLVVGTSSGTEIIDSGPVPGEPDQPLSTEAVEAKFVRYASASLDVDQAISMASSLLNAPFSSSVRHILAGGPSGVR